MATNTVPIEIVLQDAETPVGPTPTPTPESGEETNIVVPNTGTISNDGSSNGGIGSSISIVLPIVIAVLTLGATVTLLVHRQYKRKKANNSNDSTEECNTKISKKEKLATVTSGTIAILAATVLVGNLVIPATNAATSVAPGTAELETEDKITITITREAGSDSAVIANVDNVSYATVTKPFGYEIAVSMASDNSNLYLDGDETSEYYFSPVEDGVLENNTWGYTLDEEEYNAVPLVGDFAVVASGNTAVSDEEINVQYGIKVSSDMPVGAYTGELEYTLSDTGFPLSLRTMQDMTTEICDSVPTPEAFKTDGATIEDIVPTVTLPDARDNKLYRVAKLADGKCWMTQNLDLQKEDLIVASLDNSNTDHPADGFELPASQISGNESWGVDETAINTAHVYDLGKNGQEYRYCLNMSYGTCLEYGDVIPNEELANYYNWYSSTAGTGTYSLDSGDVAIGSICPAGWRLPSGSVTGDITDYSNLLYSYGIYTSPTSSGSYVEENLANLFSAPLLFVPSGNYYSGESYVGASGYYTNSMAKSNDNETDINFFYGQNGNVSPWGNGVKYGGVSVRCLAR